MSLTGKGTFTGRLLHDDKIYTEVIIRISKDFPEVVFCIAIKLDFYFEGSEICSEPTVLMVNFYLPVNGLKSVVLK